MSRFPRLAVLLAAASLLVAAAPTSVSASTDRPTATVSASCGVGDGRGFGTTYVLSIRKRNISCRKAKALIRKFHACRKAGPKGPRGRCRSPGSWRCRENRTSGRGSFDSTTRCRKGGKRVRHTYTQWT
jgi:hypothetical protein